MGPFSFMLALFLVIGPVCLIFRLVFFAMKSAVRAVFWVAQGAIFLLGFLLSGGLIAFLGIFLLLNILALPVIFLFARI